MVQNELNDSITPKDTGIVKKDFYISGGDGLNAIYRVVGTTGTMYSIHKDHLGSFDKITDNTGAVVDSYSFDAWGNRVGDIWNTPDAITHHFDRGFTGHEHLDQFGLINMNGRIYDPKLGRFLSPDPYIQEPENTQSFNRYSYCLNNPLIYNDPTGETFNPLAGIMNVVTTGARWLTETSEYVESKLNGEKDYKWNDNNYLANPHNLSNDWMNSPNVVRGPNGYPITPDGEYSPLDFMNGKKTFLDASGKSWYLRTAWMAIHKSLFDESSPQIWWIAGFDWIESGNNNDNLIFPVNPDKFQITSGYSLNRKIKGLDKKPQPHYGIDLNTPKGTPIKSPYSGRVIKANFDKQYGGGNTIVIRLDKYNLQVGFAHLSKISVNKMDIVKKGQIIGYTGNTGTHTTGFHLHFSVRKSGQRINPILYFPYKWRKKK